jgi:dihydroorotase
MILLKNLNIIHTKKGIENNLNLAVKNGKIIDIFNGDIEKKEYSDFQAINCKGLYAAPSFVDIHTHLRDPGFEYKETIETGANAAKKGGFTDLCCMANTNPVIDNEAVIKYIKDKSEKSKINIYPVAAITKALKGDSISEFGHLIDAGAVAFSDDGFDVRNSFIMKTAFEYAAFYNVPLLCHSEDSYLSEKGVMNEGYYSTLAGLRGIPDISEHINVYRNISIAEYVNAKVHICHVSSKNSIDIIKYFQNRGVNVTAETCPHYLYFTDKDVYESGYNTNFKMNPPIRSEEDKYALIKGIEKDVITSIATDHAPHAEHEKLVEFEYAPFGIIGLETAFPVSYELVLNNHISLEKLISKMSIEPAKIINIKKDEVEKNANANIVLLDLEKIKEFTKEEILSKSKNSPFIGKTFQGWPVMTIFQGEIVYRE